MAKLRSRISAADQKILDRIHKRRDLAFEEGKERREKQLDDVKFCDPSNQWPEGERAKRVAAQRPCLTVDRTNPFIDQLVNEERQNRPSMTVNPINDGADQNTAEIIQGYFRHIELNSNADFAYDRASEAQKRGGFGFIRVVTDWVSEDSFDQDLKIMSIPNPFMYYLDPSSTEPDGSDAEWGFGEEDILQSDFKAQYPDALLSGAGSAEWSSVGDSAPGWVSKTSDGYTVRLVEYYELEKTPAELFLCDDGKSYWQEDIPEKAKVVKKRNSNKIQLKWYKVCANQILERADVPGAFIPIFPVYGKELIIDGKRDYRGVVRGMKDVQRMVNVWKSAQTETIGLAPRAPWIVAIGALPDGESKKAWDTANTANHSALFFKAWDAEGRQMPMPTRNIQEPAIQAITMALKDSEEDMKAVTGMYDPSLGNRSESNQSGVAIKRLQNQGMTSNFHFTDNFHRTLRHIGRYCLSALPKVKDAEQLLRIVGIDGKQMQVKVNTTNPVKHPISGVEAIFDLTAGRYDVSIVAGPSYQSKRQENVDQLTNLAKMIPAVGELGADIIVGQMDFPAARELAERVCPPQFKKADENGPQIPPQAQQMLQQAKAQSEQAGQMIEQLTQAVHQLKDQLESKDAEIQAKIQVAEIERQKAIEVAQINAGAGLEEAIAKIMGAGAVPQLQAKIAELEQSHEELAELALHLHGAMGGQIPPPEESGEALESISTPQATPPAGPMVGTQGAPAQPLDAGQPAGME